MDEILEWLGNNEKHILGGNKRTLDILITKFSNEIDRLQAIVDGRADNDEEEPKPLSF